ncbi:hypothetical protein [Novosphingobium sp.]|uniref:hypothetical protein n=1 Tax=Novosphingobium sp. TaxID=1874826 RepID=UPI003341C64E
MAVTRSRATGCCALLALFGGGMFAPGARAQQFTYTFDQVIPGSYDEVFNLPSIGVIPLRGSDGQNFAATVAGELQALRIGTRPAFSIRTQDSGAAPGKSRKSPPDSIYARAAADKLGVKGVFWGEVTAATVSSNNFNAISEACSRNNVCSKVTTPCVKYQGTYVVTPSIYAALNSKLLYQKTIKKDVVIDVCAGVVQQASSEDSPNMLGKVGNIANSTGFLGSFGSTLGGVGNALGGIGGLTGLLGKRGKKDEQVAVTPESIMTAIRVEAAQAVVSDLTPKTRKAKVGFKTKFPEFDKDTQAKLTNAVDQLKSGRPDKACGIFQTMGEGATTKQLSLRYNLAACEEVNGNPKVARQIYEAYDREQTQVDQMLNDALKRLADVS